MARTLRNPVEGWVTLKEAGEIVNRDISTIRYWVSRGHLDCYRVGTSSVRIVNIDQVKAHSAKALRLHAGENDKRRKRARESE